MSKRKRGPVQTECGHGVVPNPCRISVDAFVACQACARLVMIGRGALMAAVIPEEAVPAPGESITLYRNMAGAFVYRAPASLGSASAPAGALAASPPPPPPKSRPSGDADATSNPP